MNGTELKRKSDRLQRMKRCQHVHVSGRRCSQPIAPNRKLCGLHPDRLEATESGQLVAVCAECRDMMKPFTPLRGW